MYYAQNNRDFQLHRCKQQHFPHNSLKVTKYFFTDEDLKLLADVDTIYSRLPLSQICYCTSNQSYLTCQKSIGVSIQRVYQMYCLCGARSGSPSPHPARTPNYRNMGCYAYPRWEKKFPKIVLCEPLPIIDTEP